MRGRITKPPAERTPRPPERTVVSSGPGANEAQQMFATGVHGAQQRWEGGGRQQGRGAGRARTSNTARTSVCVHTRLVAAGALVVLVVSPLGRYHPMVALALGVLAAAKHRPSDVAQQRHRDARSSRAPHAPVPFPGAANPRPGSHELVKWYERVCGHTLPLRAVTIAERHFSRASRVRGWQLVGAAVVLLGNMLVSTPAGAARVHPSLAALARVCGPRQVDRLSMLSM